MVVPAHLQGVAATFRVGRHHHLGPLCEGRGLTHGLTHTAPTDLTVAAALVRKAYSKVQAAALAPVAETGEFEDVGTRARPHCDGTGLCRAQIWRSGTHARKQCEIWAQFQPNPLCTLSSTHVINRANRDQSSQEAFFLLSTCTLLMQKVVKHTINLPINIKFGVAVGALPNCD